MAAARQGNHSELPCEDPRQSTVELGGPANSRQQHDVPPFATPIDVVQPRTVSLERSLLHHGVMLHGPLVSRQRLHDSAKAHVHDVALKAGKGAYQVRIPLEETSSFRRA